MRQRISIISCAAVLLLSLVCPMGGPVEAATRYFYPAEDHDWANVDNWFTDYEHTTPAGSLPAETDDVIFLHNITSLGGNRTVNTFTSDTASTACLNSSLLTVTTGATFYYYSYIDCNGAISGDGMFNGHSRINNGGSLTGSATFNDDSYLEGTVTGSATFYDNSRNSSIGTITGSGVFYDTSCNWGAVTDGATFNGTSCNQGCVTGGATFYDNSSNMNSITGATVFNGSSYNGMAVTGTTTFNNDSYNQGMITGNAVFNGSSYLNGGYNDGDVTLKTNWYNGTAPTGGVLTIGGEGYPDKFWSASVTGTVRDNDNAQITLYVFNGNSRNDGAISGDATINSTWYSGTAPTGGVFNIGGDGYADRYWNSVSGTVRGGDGAIITSYVFNGNSMNSAETLNGDVTFNDDSSSMMSALNGNVTFNTTGMICGTIVGGTVTGDFNNAGITINSGTVSSNISGDGGLTKSGAGLVKLLGASTYTGETLVTEGVLEVTGSISNSTVTVESGATVSGSGEVGTLVMLDGSYLAPGESPGTFSVTEGDLTWYGGSHYEWEIDALEGDGGSAGSDPGWDLVSVTNGDLIIDATDTQYIIDLITLSHPAHEIAPLANFDKTQNYHWLIAQVTYASGSIIPSVADWYVFNYDNFKSDYTGGSFAMRLANGDKELWLDFTGTGGGGDVPEPSTLLLLLPFIGFGLKKLRRK